jgi:hypothetical protein
MSSGSSFWMIDARAPGHVAAVLVAEGVDHQRLLAADAQKEQRPEADEASRSCDPIRQQQRLRQRLCFRTEECWSKTSPAIWE